jgi:hypothetical protein
MKLLKKLGSDEELAAKTAGPPDTKVRKILDAT